MDYSREEIQSIPSDASLGLSCGNPTALAGLKEGEVVLDLGCGGGLDVFLAAQKVNARGKVIGVDMTSEMIDLARRNAAGFRERTGLDNVEIRLGEIENLPVADASVDVILSNCVVNLSPDKPRVWREMFRVLKPGGRVSISDLALFKPLPEAVRRSSEALVACIAGACLIEETEDMVRRAGFQSIEKDVKPYEIDLSDLENHPLTKKFSDQIPKRLKAKDFVASLLIRAKKPG
jgi:arsenite methyltransferase